MANAPFLSRIPAKYLQDTEERKFWEYLISYIDKSGASSQESISDERVSEVEAASFAASLFASDSTSSATRNNQITVNGGIHYAVDGDYITALGGATIVLPQNPGNNDGVRVIQGDNNTTTIRSNNKNIIDTNQVQVTLKDSAYTFLYTVDSDYWSVL